MSMVVDVKDPDTPATYEIGVLELFVRTAYRSYDFIIGQLVRAPRDTGFYYECTRAGRTSHYYPVAWPRQENETIVDGSIEWTAKHPDNVSPITIQSVTWGASDPAGLTLDAQEESNHIAKATFSGGVHGVDYDVTAEITPTVGSPEDVTLTIPVRHQ